MNGWRHDVGGRFPGRGRLFRRRAAITLGVCGGLTFFFGAQNALLYIVQGLDVPWSLALGREALCWTAWAALAPVLLWIGHRYRLEAPGWGRNLAVHAAGAIVVCALQVSLYFGLELLVFGYILVGRSEELAALHAEMTLGTPLLLLTAFWKYWVFVGIFHAFAYYREYREREVEASLLEARLATAKLKALQMQLHPHFLFNTLHSISMLNLTDGDAANRVIVKLGELLRRAIGHDGRHEDTLQGELDFIERYLDIERLRFGDRLTVECDGEDGVRNARVPRLLLQPLVENAIRHGIAPRSAPGTIRIRAVSLDGRLAIEVRDDGCGAPEGWDPELGTGVGLPNARERLRMLYRSGARMEFETAPGAGFLVRITLPLTFQTRTRRS